MHTPSRHRYRSRARADATGRLRLLNISQHFYSGQAPINDRFDRNDYKRFGAGADAVGFDMYPIVKFCGRVRPAV